MCYEGQKTPLVQHLLKTVASNRVIIFASSKLNVKDLTRTLVKSGIKAAEIHSDLDQERRDEVMLGFRANHIDVLVATDILARGIDIDDIAMVINYEVPREAEDYVHRIGRTARAGQGGKAVTLVGPAEQPKFGQIERFLRYEVRKTICPNILAKLPPTTHRDGCRRAQGGQAATVAESRGTGARAKGAGKAADSAKARRRTISASRAVRRRLPIPQQQPRLPRAMLRPTSPAATSSATVPVGPKRATTAKLPINPSSLHPLPPTIHNQPLS